MPSYRLSNSTNRALRHAPWTHLSKFLLLVTTALLIVCAQTPLLAQTTTWVSLGANNRLVYTPSPLGDVVPDYSGVGYLNSESPIPTNIPVVATVDNRDLNANGHRDEILAAIASAATQPVQSNGYRGAVLLPAGTYNISETIRISTSGIVLRGEGTGTGGTLLQYTEIDPAYNPANDPNGDNPPDWSRLNCIEFIGAGGVSLSSTVRSRIQGNLSNGAGGTYVPYGQKFVRLPAGHGFVAGDNVVIYHQPNADWITLLNMAQYGWTPAGSDFQAERRVTRVDGNDVYLDAPVMDPIDSRYAVADLIKITGNSRLRFCGIENLRITSAFTSDIDENHGWKAVVFNDAENCWARNVHAYHFGYACVSLDSEDAIFITVDNCHMYDPKSRSTGGRKYSFNNDGQRNLFKDCQAIGTAAGRGGRHDFVSGSWTPGPSVFYNCTAVNSISDSGPHHRWTTGHLYDRVQVNSELRVRNRKASGSGHGWVGAQIMLWNCRGGNIVVQDPQGPFTNWAIGCTGTVGAGNDGEPAGVIESSGTAIAAIPSLYLAQLNDRLLQTQTITFPALPAKQFGDADFSPGATASSGLPVTYTSGTPTVATIVGGLIRIVGTGTSVITATQAGDATYSPATAVTRTLTVTLPPQPQTITFPDLPTGKRVGDADFSPGATASSGLAVTYTSSNPAVASIVSGQIRLVSAGSTTITASQAGDSTYLAATPVAKTLNVGAAAVYSARVQYNAAGRLNYPADTNRNRIPDFSHAGYKGGGIPLPTFTNATFTVTVSPVAGDDGATIQAAIDQVGNRSIQADGYRGIVLLSAGTYDIAGTLRINKSGVVLSGVGDGTNPATSTILRRPRVAPGTSNLTPVIIAGGGTNNRFRSEVANSRRAITSDFVPVGSRQFTVENTTGLSIGDNVVILHPSTAPWIAALNNGGIPANMPSLFWQPGSTDVRYHRYITALNGNTVTVDAPVFMHLDKSLSQSYLYKYDRTGVLNNIGIEDLRVEIETESPTAITHCEDAIKFVQVEDCWLRDSTMLRFWHAGVQFEEATRCTVERTRSLEPHSPIEGGYRYNFATYHAQLILFSDCLASQARHGFVANGTSNDSGNVFLNCTLDQNITFSEGHRLWSTGLLFDGIIATNRAPTNTDVVGLYNRGDYGSGHGWAVGHGVIWNSNAAGGKILVEKPPTAQNYAIGCFGNVTGVGPFAGGAGYIEHANTPGLEPVSLYIEQLRLRQLGGTTLAPQFSPGGGTYTGTQTVTLTSGDLDATIRYTLDGSTPTATTGTVYTAPISVSANTTIRAVAVQVGLTASAATSAAYTINTATTPPPASPPPASGGGGGGGGSTDPRFLLALALAWLIRLHQNHVGPEPRMEARRPRRACPDQLNQGRASHRLTAIEGGSSPTPASHARGKMRPPRNKSLWAT
jgi:hypothetical protein